MMNKDISIKINRATRMVYLSKNIIGNDAENLQANLVFTFEDDFVEGQARLEYRIDGEKRWVIADKQADKYTVPVKSVMTKEGSIYMQLVITEGIDENSVPIFKSNVFYMVCGQSINAELEEPEQYPDWIDIANTKLNRVDNLDIDATKEGGRATITVTKQDKSQQIVEILDGIGTVFVPQTTPKENGTEISWKNEGGLPNPEPVLIKNGKQGIQGEPGPKGDKGDTYTLTPQDKTDIANETKTIVMPDLEKEITLVEDKAGNKITLAVDKNYLMTLKLLNSKGKELSTASVDLPLETMVVNARYDSATKELVIVLENGNELKVPIGDLVKGLVSQATFDNAVKSLQEQITANNDELNQVVGEVSDNTKEIGLIKQEQTLLKSNITDLHDKDIELEGKITSNTNRIERVEKSFDKGTAEGEFINIKDSALAEQQEVELGVNKAQESTKGYNLLNVPKEYTFKGIKEFNVDLPADDYIFGFKERVLSSGNANSAIFFRKENNDVLFSIGMSNKYPILKHKFTEPIKKVQLFSASDYNSSQNITATFYEFMLEKGTKRGSYEPYTGGIPSPNPNYKQEINKITGSVEYTSCGENLFDKSKAVPGDLNGANGDHNPNTKNYFTSDFIKVEPNIDLFISGKSGGASCCFYDKDKKFIETIRLPQGGGTGVLKTPTNIKTSYLRINGLLNSIDTTMVELSDKATPYTPYQAISNTIDLKGNEVLPGDKIRLRFNPMTGRYEKILKKNMSEEKKQNVTSVTIAKMKPNGKFYTNVGGTLNEQTITFSKEIADLDVVYELKDDLKTEINLGEIDIMNMTYYPVTNAFTDKENVLIKLGYYRSFPETITNLQVRSQALQRQLQDIESRVKALESRPVTLSEPIESEVMPNA